MQQDDEPPHNHAPSAAAVGEALITTGEDRQEKLEKAADDLRVEMEASGQRIRELVLAQPPSGLLGYLWAQFHLGILAHQKDEENGAPDKELIKKFQFVLEYLHAVWSGHQGSFIEGQVDEAKAAELLKVCDELSSKAMFYGMASSQLGTSSEFGDASPTIEFQAKSTWVLIRGHRYQVLEEEFFKFVLAPHDDALKTAYEVDAAFIAAGVQAIADSMRGGYSDAIEKLHARMEQSHALTESAGVTLNAAIEKIKAEDGGFTAEMEGAMHDLFYGGICNLSRHTKLPTAVLADLAYEPGSETEFFATGALSGTPFRTLPARIRPLIKLAGSYYATDGQFVRDSAYRAIQRGLIARLPTYREGWNKNQKTLIEGAFPAILSAQLKDARLFAEVYFRDPVTGDWVETDLVGLVDDTLFVIEAKAGVMAMHSPATNYDRHVRTIRELVLKAYRQCKRFLEYLASASQVPIYRLKDGQYEEIAKLRLTDFRRVLPIGLTVESFTPFSSMCKEIPEVAAILGLHPFISMSVDDLFVLNRFLPTAGELFHYLEVRQALAGMPRAMIFDEIDHLGAYVTRNRFDQDIREQFAKADMVTWDSFCDVVDRHFEREKWQTDPVPRQAYPAEVAEVLEVLNSKRPKGWLSVDAGLRNLGGDGRDNLASVIRDLKPTLKDNPVRRILFGNEHPLQIWLSSNTHRPTGEEIQRQGEISCLIAKVPKVPVLTLECDNKGTVLGAKCAVVTTPPIIRNDYGTLAAEADRQRSRYMSLGKKGGKKAKRRKK